MADAQGKDPIFFSLNKPEQEVYKPVAFSPATTLHIWKHYLAA